MDILAICGGMFAGLTAVFGFVYCLLTVAKRADEKRLLAVIDELNERKEYEAVEKIEQEAGVDFAMETGRGPHYIKPKEKLHLDAFIRAGWGEELKNDRD